MPKFAIYYVPEQDDEFYRLGSQIVGYDVRTGQTVAMPSDLQKQCGQFDAAWTGISQPYGFHLTISDALTCNWATLPKIERELADLLACFNPTHRFTLRRRSDVPVGIWGEVGMHSLVLLYEPNIYFSMLHTLVVARINPLAIESVYLRGYYAHPHETLPHHAQQIRLFYSPTVLDNWFPHFTLLNPYMGAEPARVAALLADLFEPYEFFSLCSVCLLILPDDQMNWLVYREFRLPLE